MGTRSLTHVLDEDNNTIITLYRQYGGYPDGHGADIYNQFGNLTIINGIGMGQSAPEYANGIGCFAAQLVAHFKKGIGGIYLYKPNSSDCWEDYTYYISPKEDKLWLKIVGYDGEIYNDYLSGLKAWIDNGGENDSDDSDGDDIDDIETANVTGRLIDLS